MKNTGAFTLILVLFCYSLSAQQIGDKFIPALELIQEAVKLHEDKKYEEAIKKYDLVHPNDSLYDLALYEKALSCVAGKNFRETIKTAKAGLAVSKLYRRSFLILLGNAYDDIGKSDSAEIIYNIGDREFPYHYNFSYEKGVSMMKKKDFKRAMEYFRNSFSKNPFHANTHYKIGDIAANAGDVGLAMMAFQFYSMLNYFNNQVSFGIDLVEKTANNDYKKELEVPAKFFPCLSGFEDVNQILLSKIATTAKFKNKIGLNYNYNRQLQMLFEQMPRDVKCDDDVLNFYLNFYRELYEKGHFEGMIIYTFQNFTSPYIQSEVKRKKNKAVAFYQWFKKYMEDQRYTDVEVEKNGTKSKLKKWFSYTNDLESIGLKDGDGKETGEWTYFNKYGYVSAKGSFTDGKMSGPWSFYHFNGMLKSISQHKDGKLNGESVIFHANGAMEEKLSYQDNKIEGKALIFHPNQAPHFDLNIKNSKRNGVKVEYDKEGNKILEITETDGLGNGPYKRFYNNGQLSMEANFINNKLEGECNFYYDNGKIKATGNYVNSFKKGLWKSYYQNGNLKEVGNLDQKELRTGIWKEYYKNGKLYSETPYAKGNFHGVVTIYDQNGKMVSNLVYKSGKFNAYTYYNEDGTILAQGKLKSNKMEAVYYDENRIKKSEGTIENGQVAGKWSYYNNVGGLNETINYEKGVKKGISTKYYRNGQKNYEVNFENDIKEGYAKFYYKNGKLKSEGYYKNDNEHGEWKYYYINGQLSSKEFYINGEPHGKFELFYPDGSINCENNYYFGYFQDFKFPKEAKFGAVSELKYGNGKIKILNNKGKVVKVIKYLYGARDSLSVSYYPNGKIQNIMPFRVGKRHGIEKNYDQNGKLLVSGKWSFDNRDSVFNFYNEEGKLHKVINYKNGNKTLYKTLEDGKVTSLFNYNDEGELHGDGFYYARDGTVMLKEIYEDGDLTGVTFLDNKNNYLPVIPVIKGNISVKSSYPNGNPAVQYELKNGLTEGKMVFFYPGGQKMSEENMVDGDTMGEKIVYFENGKIKSRENYYYDELNGKAQYFYPNGKLMRESNYILGDKHGTELVYDITGKLIKTVNYTFDVQDE